MTFALSRAICFIISILGRASWRSSHVFLTREVCGGVSCVAWWERYARVVHGGAPCREHRGASVGRVWRGHDTPDEDSPYRARNLLKEEEEAKPATRDMPEMPVILPYSIHILPSILV